MNNFSEVILMPRTITRTVVTFAHQISFMDDQSDQVFNYIHILLLWFLLMGLAKISNQVLLISKFTNKCLSCSTTNQKLHCLIWTLVNTYGKWKVIVNLPDEYNPKGKGNGYEKYSQTQRLEQCMWVFKNTCVQFR
jgi:hypothetical protein